MTIKGLLAKHGIIRKTPRLITKATEDGGRSVKVSAKNHAAVAVWLGDALVEWRGSEEPKGIKLKLKTPRGVRVAVVDDVIIKYGTRRNKGKVTFAVVKSA